MRCPGRARWLLAAALAGAAPLPGEDAAAVIRMGPAVFHAGSPRRGSAPQPLDVSEVAARLPPSALHALGPLSSEERARLYPSVSRNSLRPKRPATRVGIVRLLPAEAGFSGVPADLEAGESRPLGEGLLERGMDGGLTWTASFSSAGAGALRLYLREAWLPSGSRVEVYGVGGQSHGPYGFEAGTRPEGFWTNTVFGSRVLLRVWLGAMEPSGLANARLFVASLVHLEAYSLAAASLNPQSQSCFVDASCVGSSEFPNIDSASLAVGQLNFVDTDGAFVCTGGLLNTTTASFAPYLLTANHCFSSQAAATSLEAFWDYKTASCGGPRPNPNSFPRTLGSTLLATSETSDFTLVLLSEDPPDGSVFLGWTTADYSRAGGTVIYRLSHPNGDPQFYSRHQILAEPDPTCSGAPQGNFLYSHDVIGGTGGGSSGSPAYLADLEVVGQELGSCGTNPKDDCDSTDNSTLDGAFRVTFPFVQPWLAPATPGPCVRGSEQTLCLHGGRFRVTASWTKASGEQGSGTAALLTNDSGYFWFFDPVNIELVVKVLDACSIADRFWVFAGGLTDVKARLTVEDTSSGAVRIYDNPLGMAFAPLQDTSAFLCP